MLVTATVIIWLTVYLPFSLFQTSFLSLTAHLTAVFFNIIWCLLSNSTGFQIIAAVVVRSFVTELLIVTMKTKTKISRSECLCVYVYSNLIQQLTPKKSAVAGWVKNVSTCAGCCVESQPAVSSSYSTGHEMITIQEDVVRVRVLWFTLWCFSVRVTHWEANRHNLDEICLQGLAVWELYVCSLSVYAYVYFSVCIIALEHICMTHVTLVPSR